MPRYLAFLRGLNVGGHTVKMDALKRHFAEMGFADVATFIASGNVIFSSPSADEAVLEGQVEAALRSALGYEVATFLRSDRELAQIAALDPFPGAARYEADHHYVLFLKGPPAASVVERLAELSNDQDVLRVHGRELHWLRRGTLLETTLDQNLLGKTIGLNSSRNVNTVQRLAAKYPAS